MSVASGKKLSGHHIVVTGGGRGLGFAIAGALGSSGARVYIAEVDAERGKAAEAALTARRMDVRYVAMDVADPASIAACADEILSEGPVFGLVNNAALADGVGGSYFWEIPVEDWDRLMVVNARGPWLVTRALVGSMINMGTGRIVNIASDAALYGSPRLAHYIASKGALIAMTKAMAREVGSAGITVNAVAPGLTVTESTNRVPAERHDLYRSNRAIERDQTPDDIVGLVVFLLGPASSYITGQLVVVDGGFVFH